MLAPNADPLVDPADLDEALLDNAVGRRDLERLGRLELTQLAVGQPSGGRRSQRTGRPLTQ